MKSPIVEFITPEKTDKAGKKKVSEYTDEDLFDISIANVINNASWKLSDVLLATPITLTHVLQKREKYEPFDINPQIVIIDECDLLLQDETLRKSLLWLLRKFAS